MNATSFNPMVSLGLCGCLWVSGCGQPAPRPLPMDANQVATLDPATPYVLPANTRLTATQDSTLSFPAADLFQPGDVIGQIVDIDNDALMRIAPHNETIDVILKSGQSMRITQDRVITLTQPSAASRFQVNGSQ